MVAFNSLSIVPILLVTIILGTGIYFLIVSYKKKPQGQIVTPPPEQPIVTPATPTTTTTNQMRADAQAFDPNFENAIVTSFVNGVPQYDRKSYYSGQSSMGGMVDNNYNNISGMSDSSYYNPINVYEPTAIQTEQQLLRMARSRPPQPEFIYDSKLRRDGNPFVGDLVIKPRQYGVNVPLAAEPSDLQNGYFSERY